MDPRHATSLFEGLPIGAYRSTIGGRQVRANAALVRLNGYATEDELLEAVRDIGAEWYVQPGRREAFRALMAQHGEVCDFVSEVFRHKTRERIWVRETAYLVRDAQGEPLYYEGTVEDITEARQSQLALARSEQRFRRLTEKAQVLTMVCDAQGVVGYASPASHRLLGMAPEALLGRRVVDWLHPDDQASAALEFNNVVQGRNTGGESVYRARHADGSWRHVAALGTNALDDPAIGGVVLNYRDVTEREAAAARLRVSEQQFQHAFAASPDALVISRLADGAYLAVNDTFVRLSGFARNELIGRTSVEMHIWHSAEARAAFVEAFRGAGRVRDFVAPYRGRGDRQGVVSISAEPIEVDGQPCVLAISRDVTQQLADQAALQRLNAELEQRVVDRTRELAHSEQRHRHIVDAVPVAIVEQDWQAVAPVLRDLLSLPPDLRRFALRDQPDRVAQCRQAARVVHLNQAARQLFAGATPVALPCSLTAWPPADTLAGDFTDLLIGWLDGLPQHSVATTWPTAGGTPRHLLATTAWPVGRDGMVLTSLTDISEPVRLSQALDASLAEARRINRELETFAYSVSHDLKAPLRALDGYSLLLAERAQGLDEESRAYLQHIRAAARQMARLINDLLASARLEQRTQAIAPLQCADLVQQVLAHHAADLARLGVQPEVSLPDLPVLADASSLTLALRNLVDNALKFSAGQAAPRLHIGGELRAGEVLLWVRDNGCGFDLKHHDRIFQIFQRLHRAEDVEGTGIGLASVAKAMERMGGRVWADSAPGAGATFYLALPRG
jgi:PAS domain S-box-containing protein